MLLFLTQVLGLTCFFFGVVVMVAARCLGAAMMVMMKSGEAFSGKRGFQFGQTSLIGFGECLTVDIWQLPNKTAPVPEIIVRHIVGKRFIRPPMMVMVVILCLVVPATRR